MATNSLKDKLNKHGITQVELSKESGRSIGLINKVCNKKITPSPTTKYKILNALNKLSDENYTIEDIFK